MNAPALPDPLVVAESVKAWAAAVPRFAGLLATGTPTVLALTRWSLELLRGNQTADAILVLRSALALKPGDPALWTNYGAALNQENSPNEAAACLEHSLALSRQQPDTWLLLGMVRQKLGDQGAAEAAYRIALDQEPNSFVAWQLLGLLKQEQRDYAAAIDCLTACIKSGGVDPALLANLGKLCYQLGRIPEAYDAYTRAAGLDAANLHYRRMARKSGFLRAVLQGESVDAAITGFKKSFLPEESGADQELVDLFKSAFPLLCGFGHIDAATRVGRKQLELWPGDPSVTYLLKAVTGDSGLDRSAPEYVVGHFDAFAEGFDAQLVGALGYDIPEKICSAVHELGPAGRLYDTLDAGCGTGLCGPLLRSRSRKLTGVDLSPRMLEQAQKRGIYDALTCEELTSFLRRSPSHFDLIVAADVFIYFGDLDPIFSGAAIALRPGGILACSTELWTGDRYRLQPSGRFAQAPAYVRSVAAAEFEELVYIETTIRLEASGRLPGNIFIFRRRTL
jgi:predicted TPR repeat methyltransferase